MKSYLIYVNNLFYFINTYTYKNDIELDKELLNKFKLETDSEDNIIDDEKDDFNGSNLKKSKKIEKEDVIKVLKEINYGDIWDYLKEALDNFQSTIYSTFLIKKKDEEEDKKYEKEDKLKGDVIINQKFFMIEYNPTETNVTEDKIISNTPFKNLKKNDKIKIKKNDKHATILKVNKDNTLDIIYKKGESTGINLKNLYNIAKLLSYNKDPWKIKCENYISLTRR